MLREPFYIAQLVSSYLCGTISDEKRLKLEQWRQESEKNESLFQHLCDKEQIRAHYQAESHYDARTGWKEVERKIKQSSRKRRYIKIAGYAALFILPLILFITVSINQPATPDTDTARMQPSTTSYHEISVPRGKECTLRLSDGSKVHISAMSTLRFPVQFAGATREVTLKGEAFFEVAKKKIPFIVKTAGTQVEVLGTVFNISAYPGEEYQATLLSGSVKVKTNTSTGSILLKPAQQACIAVRQSNISVHEVDPAFYTSWVTGKINFRDQTLEHIMNTLSRWYDFKVNYSNESLKKLKFGCSINRSEEIAPFIELLKKTGKMRVEVKEKTIVFKTIN